MNDSAAFRVLSFLNDTNQQYTAALATEKHKVTVIGEEHEPEELLEQEPLPNVIDNETDSLPPERIKEFFKAIEDGSIDRLEELFDTVPQADPNMTNFTESLLMAAIRAKRTKIAEYLIDQLGIDVNHRTDLIEFRVNTAIPVRERIFSCRDLAYDKGMMELVDLIDITSDDVKPNVKGYLQRRLKTRLDEIHRNYLKRMKERSKRSIIQTQERENRILEQEEEEKDNQDIVIPTPTDETSLPPSVPPPPPPVINPRVYKSHIEETIQKIESKYNKSIDETQKKRFRFSNYTLRFRLIETTPQASSKPKRYPFHILPSRIITTNPTTPAAQPYSRPTTTATTMTNLQNRSLSEVSARIPIRETRTSICRSARHISTPRVSSSIPSEPNPEIKPPTIPTSSHSTQRLLPKRFNPIPTNNYGYVPQMQNVLYNEPHRFMPVTFRSTAIGLPLSNRLIRD